ncbi:hypothetical protein [Fusibacter sp. JL216-2]|uniref:hypothetical protein n=1 Tax=Fusibacter sp. JL216-2 TaxID=3071453 RepID=UPI003D32D30B
MESSTFSFSISNVVTDAVDIYKNNKKTLLGLSVISAIISQVFSFIMNISNSRAPQLTPVSGLVTSLSFIIMLVVIYYSTKLWVAMQISVIDAIKNDEISISSSYKRAEESVWKFLRASLKIFLILFIPFILLISGMMPRFSLFMRVTFLIIGVVAIIFFGTKYAFGPFIRIVEPDNKKYLKASSTLVNRNFKEVVVILAIYWILLLPTFLNTQYGDVLFVNDSVKFILEKILLVIGVLYHPFQVSLLVRTYYELSESSERTQIVKNVT